VAYNLMTMCIACAQVPDLKKALKELGLSDTGLKAALVARLKEALSDGGGAAAAVATKHRNAHIQTRTYTQEQLVEAAECMCRACTHPSYIFLFKSSMLCTTIYLISTPDTLCIGEHTDGGSRALAKEAGETNISSFFEKLLIAARLLTEETIAPFSVCSTL
jgi:hypothetical protein